MKKGKLFVIDGGDGSGKATQTELLVKKLQSSDFRVETLDFPRYYNNFFGKLIGQAQKNLYGEFSKIHPKIASVLYACDRSESREQLEEWLSKGIIVVLDRYVSANQLHQAGKINDDKERQEFLRWLDELEHKVNKIPRPDMVIYLEVPHEISLKLMKEKNAGTKKQYNGGEMDMVEQDEEYQLHARESGLKMLENPTWRKVKCSDGNGGLRSREDIHNEILSHVWEQLK